MQPTVVQTVVGKRIRLAAVIAALLLLAAPTHDLVAQERAIEVLIGSAKLALEVPPLIEQGRTLVPMRAILEAVDAKVAWDAKTRTVTASKQGITLILTIGNGSALVNGKETPLDVPARILEGRTLVPLRFVSENLGERVTWNPETRTISIKRDEAILQGSTPAEGVVEGDGGGDEDDADPENSDGSIFKGPRVGEGGNDADQIFRSLAVSPVDPRVLYVGSEGNGIFKSSDGGAAWNWFRKGLKTFTNDPNSGAYPEIWDLVIHPRDPDLIFIAATGGGPGPLTGGFPSANGGVYRSKDGGRSWVQLTQGLPNGAVGSIAVDPDDPLTVYAGLRAGRVSFSGPGIQAGWFFEGGVYQSTDGGESWRKLPLPAPADQNEFWEILALDSGTLFALGLVYGNQPESLGIVRSLDAGTTWTKIAGPQGIQFHYFTVSPQDADLIYVLQRDTWKVYKSADGGRGWQEYANGASGPIAASPFDKQTVLFAANNELFKSTNGLVSARKVLSVQPAARFIMDIEFTPDPKVIYAGARGLLIYKSIDGGETFQPVANLREYIDSQ
ncbi:MAG: hypothetical protein HYY09_06275 [Firmicutes bacterium]|nr:hypothetical protein [Bacillota bacterium]